MSAIIGIAADAIGREQEAQATEEGAKVQAKLEEINRKYQRKIFDEQVARQLPFYEEGRKALPMLEQYRTEGGRDLAGNPLYDMQLEQGLSGLQESGHTRPGTASNFRNMLNAGSQQPAYNRLLDLQRVGLGASGQAGNYAENLGGALTQSYQRGGNALWAGEAQSNQQRESMYSNALGQLGNAPANYYYQQRRRNG